MNRHGLAIRAAMRPPEGFASPGKILGETPPQPPAVVVLPLERGRRLHVARFRP